jgi:hypothetical protein
MPEAAQLTLFCPACCGSGVITAEATQLQAMSAAGATAPHNMHTCGPTAEHLTVSGFSVPGLRYDAPVRSARRSNVRTSGP